MSGASGLVGKALIRSLEADGHNVARLVRPGATRSPGDIAWDPASALVDLDAMDGFDAAVHLSGANIAQGRWTEARKAELRSSRVDTTRVLVDALAKLKRKPRVLACASAIGYYGDRGDEILTELSSYGNDFIGLLVRDWEAEAVRAETSGMRVVRLRFGVVLSSEGGALPLMLLPFKFGVGGRLGSGRQWQSWVAQEDAIEITRRAIADESLSGAINVTAPNPLRNMDFTRIVGQVLHRPAIIPVPAFAMRLLLGEMAEALALASERVVPERLLRAGFNFKFAEFEPALRAVLSEKS
jgi:uncharacterized protein (TIGR01777 family)